MDARLLSSFAGGGVYVGMSSVVGVDVIGVDNGVVLWECIGCCCGR